MSAELSALFIEQTKKLAALAAAVGLHGDQTAEELAAGGRRLMVERRELLAEVANARARVEEDMIDRARLENKIVALRRAPLLTGKLTHAGHCLIGEEWVDGVFIAISREQIMALPRLPMYEEIELRVVAKGTP